MTFTAIPTILLFLITQLCVCMYLAENIVFDIQASQQRAKSTDAYCRRHARSALQ